MTCAVETSPLCRPSGPLPLPVCSSSRRGPIGAEHQTAGSYRRSHSCMLLPCGRTRLILERSAAEPSGGSWISWNSRRFAARASFRWRMGRVWWTSSTGLRGATGGVPAAEASPRRLTFLRVRIHFSGSGRAGSLRATGYPIPGGASGAQPLVVFTHDLCLTAAHLSV